MVVVVVVVIGAVKPGWNNSENERFLLILKETGGYENAPQWKKI